MKNILIVALITLSQLSCKKDDEETHVPPEAPTGFKDFLLKDVVVSNEPSPAFHFEYNTDSTIKKATIASNFSMYDVSYQGKALQKLQNTTMGNHDRLEYEYENGKPTLVKFIDENGITFQRIFFNYTPSKQLKTLEYEQKSINVGFIMIRNMDFTYSPDGNLSTLTDHRPFVENIQPEATFIDKFENYDDKHNAGDFTVIHKAGDNHLLLLPGITLQYNNAKKITRTGDGLQYELNFTYNYNSKQLPVSKNGIALITHGPDAGKQFPVNINFSYYE